MTIDPIKLVILPAIAVNSFFGFILLLRRWQWLPVILLPLIWYLPGQTAPGGLLEDFLIFRWFTVLLIPGLFFIQAFKNIISRERFKPTFLAMPLVGLVVVSMLSAWLNDVCFFDLVGYLAIYLRYPLLFIILMNIDLSDRIVKWVIGLFLFLVLIQVPEIVYRYQTTGVIGDRVSETLGSYGTYSFGVYSLYAMALITGNALVTRVRILHLTAFGLLMITAIIGEIKVVVLAAPIIILAVILFHQQRQSSQIVNVGYVRKLVIIIFIVFIVLSIYGNWGRIQRGPNTLVRFIDNISTLVSGSELSKGQIYRINRIGSTLMVWDMLKATPLNFMFGLGPGSSLAGGFSGTPGHLFSLMPQSFMLTQISATLADVGVVGFFIYIWIFLRLFKHLLLARSESEDVLFQTLLYGSFGIWIFYVILGPIYNIVWRSDAASYIFYFLMAVICKQITQDTRTYDQLPKLNNKGRCPQI